MCAGYTPTLYKSASVAAAVIIYRGRVQWVAPGFLHVHLSHVTMATRDPASDQLVNYKKDLKVGVVPRLYFSRSTNCGALTKEKTAMQKEAKWIRVLVDKKRSQQHSAVVMEKKWYLVDSKVDRCESRLHSVTGPPLAMQ